MNGQTKLNGIMSIFGIFSSGNNSDKQLTIIKNDLEKLTGRLEAVASALNEHSQQIKSLPIDQLPDKIKGVIKHLESQDVKMKETADLYDQLRQMTPGSEEVQEHAVYVKKNMMAFNAVLELDLKDANSSLRAFNSFCHEFAKPVTNINKLTDELSVLKESMKKLVAQIENLENGSGQ